MSIHATAVTTLVCTESGRMNASYTAGRPPTVRPTGCHCPSPGAGGLAKGEMAGGVGR